MKFILPFGISFGAGYTFTDAESETTALNTKTQMYETKKNDVDKSVRHVANVNVAYDKTWQNYHMNLSLAGHVQGRRYSSTYGYASGYGQWDFNTRHTVTLKQFVLEPGFGVDNIFDKKDRSYWTSNFSTVSPGRSFYVSLAMRFKK